MIALNKSHYWEERPYYDNVRMCEKFYIPSVLFDFVCNAVPTCMGKEIMSTRNKLSKKQIIFSSKQAFVHKNNA